jgi:hypothetical protein
VEQKYTRVSVQGVRCAGAENISYEETSYIHTFAQPVYMLAVTSTRRFVLTVKKVDKKN